MTGTFIKLFRDILNWGWYSDYKTCRVFTHLLLKASICDREWKGVKVHRGQVPTSYASIAEETGLTVQNVRTAIKNLKSTHEVTSEATSRFTLITIVKYSDYQDKGADGNKPTNKRPNKELTSDQQASNNNIRKKEYKKEKNIYIGRSFSPQIIAILDTWFQYKKERKDSYQPTGLQAFLTRVENKLKDHSEQDVIKAINESMSNNWKGVAWDKLKKQDNPVMHGRLGANARPTGNYDHLAFDLFAEEYESKGKYDHLADDPFPDEKGARE